MGRSYHALVYLWGGVTMRWLLTGSSGYLGLHVAAELADADIPFVGLDKVRSLTGDGIIMDITDFSLVNGFLSTETFSGLIHLAALKNVTESESKKQEYVKVNVDSFENLLRNIRLANDAKIIFASSAAVYGMNSGEITEEVSAKPISHYGITKVKGEEVLENFVRINRHLKAFNFRIFNMGGHSLSGSQHPISTGVFSSIYNAYKLKSPFSIFGAHRPTPDGTAVRDYIHVSDVAIAIRKAIQTKTTESFNVLNISTGLGTSVTELVRAFESFTGEALNLALCPKIEGDIDFSIGCNKKAQTLLNWKPQKSLSEIVESEIRIKEA
jgi:UDP-glucose 4-epimerase